MGSVKIKGLDKLEKEFREIPNKTMKGIEKAMGIIYDSSQPLVPVDTGALKRSGVITEVDGGYQIKYHSENKKTGYNYAPIQHENLSYHHNIGQAKYLEDAIKQNEQAIIDAIVGEVLK